MNLLTKEIKEKVIEKLKSEYDKSIYEPILIFKGGEIAIELAIKLTAKEIENIILKEIEKEIRESEEREYEAQKENMVLEVENEQGYQEGLRDAIRIIKKAFEGIE